MYVGIDIGGTKTLVAVLNEHGVIKQEVKFPSPKSYDNFILELRHVATNLETTDFKAGVVGIPGRVDRKHGRGLALGNLPWRNFNIQYDSERILHCPITIENDAKLAGLSEAMLLKDKYDRVAYVTVSTGIGYAMVVNGVIDSGVGDSGGHALQLEHKGQLMAWEKFASGKAIVERFGKKAADINDEKTWKEISYNLAKGLIQLIAILEPEVIVIGGSVGTYFDRYAEFVAAELKKYELPMVAIPPLRQAQRPEKAVLYGCYDLAKQIYPTETKQQNEHHAGS
jgi:glucokinase